MRNRNYSLEKTLNEFIGKNVIITQDGFFKGEYSVHKLNYSIEYELLNITDEESKNCLQVNLNQIYKIENNEKEIKLYLDNDMIIYLTI